MSAAVAFLGGAVGGAVITQAVTLSRSSFETRVRRRSCARLLHEDFLRQQSTVARAYYRGSDARPSWWTPEEFLPLMAAGDIYGEVLGALRGERYVAVASAIGWMEYLRAAREAHQPAPPRPDLVKAYQRLGTTRYALSRLGKLEYREHKHAQMAEGTPIADQLNFRVAQAQESLAGLKDARVEAERPLGTSHRVSAPQTSEVGA